MFPAFSQFCHTQDWTFWTPENQLYDAESKQLPLKCIIEANETNISCHDIAYTSLLLLLLTLSLKRQIWEQWQHIFNAPVTYVTQNRTCVYVSHTLQRDARKMHTHYYLLMFLLSLLMSQTHMQHLNLRRWPILTKTNDLILVPSMIAMQ